MPPYSEPVNLNPIVETPPVFTDTGAFPNGTIIDSKFLQTAALANYNIRAIAYDSVNDEIFALDTDAGNISIIVYSGYNNTVARTLAPAPGIPSSSTTGNGMVYRAGYVYLVMARGDGTVKKIDAQTGVVVSTVDFNTLDLAVSGAGTKIYIDIRSNGDLVAVGRKQSTGNGVIYVMQGISNVIKKDFPTGSGGALLAPQAFCLVYDDFHFTVTGGVYVMDDDALTATKILDVSLPGLPPATDYFGCTRIQYNGEEHIIFVNNVGGGTTFNTQVSARVDLGEAFTGSSGKALQTKAVYSFYITGPNTITDPTLNDGGQGAKTIVLPDYSAPPVGTVQGYVSLEYDGNLYVVRSLDPALANQVYTDLSRVASGSTDQSALGFDTWRVNNTARPVFVEATIRAQTDGVTNGAVKMDVDESGGTAVDYYQRTIAHSAAGAGVNQVGNFSMYIPPGGSYRINNQSDPNAANSIISLREIVQ